MLSILTFDVIVSKMAKKDLGPWFVVIAGISLLDKLTALFLSIAYMVSVIYEISTYMNIPVLTTNINVYVCGVYDLMHDGHYLSMKNALNFGNKLFAGVHGDEVCTNYKRQPVNSHIERCKNVENCKYVSVVIPNAPLYITEKELIDNNIHFVVCADTYFNDPNDKYYDVPRKMGILRMVPYSHGISTSDLIKRIVERFHSNKDTACPIRNEVESSESSSNVADIHLTYNKIGKNVETYIDNNINTIIDNDLQNKIFDKDIECEILDDPAFSY
jgi:choline-phosphate cytidylyltransferase